MKLHDAHVRLRQAWIFGDRRLAVRQYRRHILSRKAEFGAARGLVHYRQMVDAYLLAKRMVLR